MKFKKKSFEEFELYTPSDRKLTWLEANATVIIALAALIVAFEFIY